MPVASVYQDVAAEETCEPRSARAGFRRRAPLGPVRFARATAIACAWPARKKRITGRRIRAKAKRALLTICACPPRDSPGTRVTGLTCPRVWKTCVHVRPAETLLGCGLAKGRAVERVEVPSAATKPLRERRRGSSVRAWTAPPSRRLRGGMARESARLFDSLSGAVF